LKSFEKGESYKRRVDWLPMYGKPTKKDKDFISKLTTPEALQYWIKLIVEGYFRIYENKGFTESQIISEFNDKYHLMNNNIIEFLEDYTQEHFEGKRSKETYGEYEVWAEENGLNPLGKKLFQEMMLKIHNLELRKTSRNGKSARLYLRQQ
jgi:putative DNA primase/helicase